MTAQPVRPIDMREFRNTCGAFATGVTLVTTRADGLEHGMTANAFMSISLDPPLIAVSVAVTAKMLGFIRASRRFAVSVLPEQGEEIAWHFAGRPKQGLSDPFGVLDDLPIAREAVAAFAADVAADIPAGDHIVFLGHVTAMQHDAAARPLLFHSGRFGALRGEHAGRTSPEALLDAFWWGFGEHR